MNIVWDISNECNLCCKHCGAIDMMRESQKLSVREKNNIAENILMFATKVTLLGGEPLLADGIENIIEIFEKKNILVDLITNGQFDFNDVKGVIDHENIGTILVSIEGLEKENDQIRGNETYKNAVSFLKKIKKYKKNNTRVGITTVITKKNIHNLLELINSYEQLDVDEIYFNFLDISGNAKINRSELEPDKSELIKAAITIAKYAATSREDIYINTGSRTLDRFLLLEYGFVNSSIEKKCGALFESAYIDMNGFFHPCRSYSCTKIDLKNPIDLKKEYRKFIPFWGCLIESEQKECPISDTRDLFKEEVDCMQNKARYTVVENAIFQNIENQHFIIFPKNNEYVEYSEQGYLIYRLLTEFEDNEDIICKIGCSREDYLEFVEHEILNKRLEVTHEA